MIKIIEWKFLEYIKDNDFDNIEFAKTLYKIAY